jgi:chemotaxis protein methyltransferase CheR
VITGEQFDRARRLALRVTGIELFDRHRDALVRRSGRLGIHDREAFDALLDAAERGEGAGRRRLIGLVTTKFTGFFRHPQHFEVATGHALEAVRARGEARLWSAAAATGEEPYSLAISIIEAFGTEAPPVGIVAADIDEDALAVAREGVYGEQALCALDPNRRARFFVEAVDATRWRIDRTARRLVTFRAANLTDPVWPLEGPVDVILCRNVLMYLGASYRQAVLERLASTLAPDGVLILDPAENLGKAGHLFALSSEGIYRRRAGRARSDPAPSARAPR